MKSNLDLEIVHNAWTGVGDLTLNALNWLEYELIWVIRFTDLEGVHKKNVVMVLTFNLTIESW